MARMEADLAWFADLSAQDRSWVGLIVQAGIRSFVEWYDATRGRPRPRGTARTWPPRSSGPRPASWPG